MDRIQDDNGPLSIFLSKNQKWNLGEGGVQGLETNGSEQGWKKQLASPGWHADEDMDQPLGTVLLAGITASRGPDPADMELKSCWPL